VYVNTYKGVTKEMAKKKGDYSEGSIRRSMARGAGARGQNALNSNGSDAFNVVRRSTKGHYRIEFMNVYENRTNKDVELRITYGKDLVAQHIGVPIDMVTLKQKKTNGNQTLTSLDEVFYVKVGQDVAGKLSIRTQRLWKKSNLIFIFQAKKIALKPPQKAFVRSKGFKKRTTSQIAESKRKGYHKRRGGTY